MPDVSPSIELTAEFNEDDTFSRLLLSLKTERAFITTLWGELVNMQHHVEDGFFATWCALNGLLTEKYNEALLIDWKQRRKTPLQFINEACGGLL